MDLVKPVHLILLRDCRTGGLLSESMAVESEDVQPKHSSWPFEERVDARSGNCAQRVTDIFVLSCKQIEQTTLRSVVCALLLFQGVGSNACSKRRLTDGPSTIRRSRAAISWQEKE